MTSSDMMRHMNYIDQVAEGDTAVLRTKEATYMGSWKAAGGRSAWFMARRNMDRLLNMMARPRDTEGFSIPDLDDALENAKETNEELTLDVSIVQYLRDSYVSENIFAKIRENPEGQDGTVLACLRDLRRYFILIEAEMIARGVVVPEGYEPAASMGTHIHEGLPKFKVEGLEIVHVDVKSTLAPVPVPKLFTSDGNIIYTSHLYVYQHSDNMEYMCRVLEIYGDGTVLIDLGQKGQYRTEPGRLSAIGKKNTEEQVIDSVRAAMEEPLINTIKVEVKADPQEEHQPYGQAPWLVDKGWRLRHGYATGVDRPDGKALTKKEMENINAFSAYYQLKGPFVWVLEASVLASAGLPPSHAAHLYRRVGEFNVLDIAMCPKDARHWFPQLLREVNSVTRDELPAWQRDLYEWTEATTKWLLKPSHDAWADRD